MVVRLSALRAGRLYPQEMLLVLISIETESTPGPYCDRKDFMSMKNSNDTSWDRTSDLPPFTIESLEFNSFEVSAYVLIALSSQMTLTRASSHLNYPFLYRVT